MTEQEAELLARASWDHCFGDRNKTTDAEGVMHGKRCRSKRCLNENRLSKSLKY